MSLAWPGIERIWRSDWMSWLRLVCVRGCGDCTSVVILLVRRQYCSVLCAVRLAL